MWNINVLVPIISCLGCSLLGLFVFWKNPKLRVNQFFALLLVVGGFWALGGYFKYQDVITNQATVFPVSWEIISTILTGYSLIFFSWYFPHKNSNLKKEWIWAYNIFSLVVLVLGFLGVFSGQASIVSGQYVMPAPRYYKIIYLPYFVGSIIYGLINMGIKYKRIENYFEKQKIKYLFFGYIIGFATGITGTILLPLAGYRNLQIIGTGAPLLGNLSVAYAIVRYRLMEIDTIVHKTLLWFLTLLLLVLPVSAILFLLKSFLYEMNMALFVISNGLFMILFVKYYGKLKPEIDHLFRRRKYDYAKVLSGLGEKIGSELNLDHIVERILKELKEILYIRNAVIVIQEKGQLGYVAADSFGYEGSPKKEFDKKKTLVLTDEHKLSRWLNKEKRALEKQVVEIDPQYTDLKSETIGWMEKYQIEAVVPIIVGDRVNAILGLGRRANLQSLTLKDIELLENIGRQVGVIIDNALNHGDIIEKALLSEELKLGREIQKNLLPQALPDVLGLKVAGFMRPAKDIGGDYYDFLLGRGNGKSDYAALEIPAENLPQEKQEQPKLAEVKHKENKISIVIGDVSGKGTAAGLIMATVKAILDTLSSEQYLSPKKVLARTNSILCKYTQGTKFMTLLLLDWDSQQKSLEYSSAGHEHIIICRSPGSLARKDKETISSVAQAPAGKTEKVTLGGPSENGGFVECIKSGGMPLGILPELEKHLEIKQIKLDYGDKVVLFTDGVTEAGNEQGELFGLSRLIEMVKKYDHKDAAGLLKALDEELYGFMGKSEQNDDITLVIMESVRG